MPKKSVIMDLFAEKKHSVRYSEQAAPDSMSDSEALRSSVCGDIYVRKAALPKPFPKTIVVTVEWQE